MNTIKLFIPVLLITIICTLAVSCIEDPLLEQEEIRIEVAGRPLGDPTPPAIDTTELISIYIEWNPRTLQAYRDQIRASYNDVNGIVYLYDYEVCAFNQNVEKWRVIINYINPDDQTPPPLVILMDTEDEMDRGEYFNFSLACSF